MKKKAVFCQTEKIKILKCNLHSALILTSPLYSQMSAAAVILLIGVPQFLSSWMKSALPPCKAGLARLSALQRSTVTCWVSLNCH